MSRKEPRTTSAHTKALTAYRHRQTRKGLVRLELQIRKDDAGLLRSVARALSDPTRATATRALLEQEFGDRRGDVLKAVLAAAPADLDLEPERPRETGRDVEL
ncbi:hypothetical protein PQJ75_21860 [Rhodoplanes sp. TEM]|uniref:Plasmid stability protein n=1 Tax=Rhodoplanes tepidamans TaxID=200616 RepID=A0ABT5JHL7_RHOTP|nr:MULTISPECIES: hypothetical protein [Rhodoplanes]MDC7788993.1 hypothetical protein [Rhodoplanes tepidamans]MDC7986384.1 hypothetical protein [Rhodoplanes sp. TEM]MDQ0355706.1 hypothetical protein [Rhodoplanes tepidamans]